MQKLIFALIIVGVSAAPFIRNDGPIPGYKCPQADIDATGCKGPKDCLYPNPDDCHTFIQCNDGGLAYVMPCAPKDLVYNDTLKQCDYPTSTKCNSGTQSSPAPTETEAPTTATPVVTTTTELTTEEPTTTAASEETTAESTTEAVSEETTTAEATTVEETTTGAAETTPESEPETTTAEVTTEQESETTTEEPTTEGSGAFVCPEKDIADTKCLGPKDCLYPNPDSCDSYIHCEVNADNKTGTPTVQPCPSGEEWNDDKKECDYPANSTCPKQSLRL